MKKIEIFDPAMCCPTDLCETNIDPELMRIAVVIETVFEAERLQMDLQRAGINNKWWVVNACLSLTDTENSFLRAKAQNELVWIKKVEELSKGNAALIAWKNN